jgi:hypothetical protein
MMNDPPRRLLILACTATKRRDQNPMPALRRYDGPSFRTVRKWQTINPNDAQQMDILILSAKLGLIAADTPIEDYDQRMTPERAAVLQPVVSSALQQFLAKHGPYAATLVHLGQDYIPTLVPNLDRSMDAVQRSRQLREELIAIAATQLGTLTLTEGGIGARLGQLKRWLENLSD